MIGITDNDTRERLLRTDGLTLEKAVCKTAELVKQQAQKLKFEAVSPSALHTSTQVDSIWSKISTAKAKKPQSH